jgi:hypothetical protein
MVGIGARSDNADGTSDRCGDAPTTYIGDTPLNYRDDTAGRNDDPAKAFIIVIGAA